MPHLPALPQGTDPQAGSLHTVFLVEDEIVAREGIRDNVDWAACGFRLVGEAADGETALPLIQQKRPDVLITDIRMPFMDGLSLSRLVRERLPSCRIIIYSGFDDFSYAQTAIELGVSSYLLKPVTAGDLMRALAGVRTALEDERRSGQARSDIESRLNDSRSLARADLLRRLLLGEVEVVQAVEEATGFSMDLLAGAYAVVAVQMHGEKSSAPSDMALFEQCAASIFAQIEHRPRVLALRKDVDECLLLVQADSEDEATGLAQHLAREVAAIPAARACDVVVGTGPAQTRLSDLPRSTAGALHALRGDGKVLDLPLTFGALPETSRCSFERFLRFGAQSEMGAFLSDCLSAESIAHSPALATWLYTSAVLAASEALQTWGAPVAETLPELSALEAGVRAAVADPSSLRSALEQLLQPVLAWRDSELAGGHAALLAYAQAIMLERFADPGLTLPAVATQVNLSPSYFSYIFSRDMGVPFKEHLTTLRIEHASMLLRTTSLRIGEIATQSGYTDAHYFSTAFKRATGLSPRGFRHVASAEYASSVPSRDPIS